MSRDIVVGLLIIVLCILALPVALFFGGVLGYGLGASLIIFAALITVYEDLRKKRHER